jgi:hypothetical protein
VKKNVLMPAMFLCLAVSVAGCVQTKQVKIDCQLIVSPETEAGRADLKKEIDGLTRELKGKAKTDAMKHLRLAMLLIHRNNPSPDFRRAKSEMDIFLSSYKGSECVEHARNIRNLIVRAIDTEKSMKRARKKTSELEASEALCAERDKECTQLQEELQSCKENIIKLQSLDIQMERKRKSLR